LIVQWKPWLPLTGALAIQGHTREDMSVEEKAIEEAANTARHYLDEVLLSPLSEYGLFLKEKVSYWRFKNQVTTAIKARAFLEKKGVSVESIRGKVSAEAIVPLLEASSETGDPSLSDMFASLIAGAMSPDSAVLIHPSYGKVLNQLSALDGFIIHELYKSLLLHQNNLEKGVKPDKYNENLSLHRQLGFDEVKLSEGLNRPVDQVHICFQNLIRLGICDEGHDFLNRANKVARISFTDYGFEFVKRCTENIK